MDNGPWRKPCVSSSDGYRISRCNPYAAWPRWPATTARSKASGAAVPHGERCPRDLVPLPLPATEAEANAWLFNYVLRYNDCPIAPNAGTSGGWVHISHRGPAGDVCWERFCAFAREPEVRKVATSTTRVSMGGVRYEVESGLGRRDGDLWFGL